MSAPTVTAPTQRQLRYLRVLAAKTATSFTYPHSRAEASREIERLRKLEFQPHTPCLQGDVAEAEGLLYATAVHASEVSGWGSSASWRAGSRTSEWPELPRVPPDEPSELARYKVTGAERVLRGQRVGGALRVTDDPAAPGGRSYLVECEVELDADGVLEALIADYLAQAGELDQVPMASEAIAQMLGRPSANA